MLNFEQYLESLHQSTIMIDIYASSFEAIKELSDIFQDTYEAAEETPFGYDTLKEFYDCERKYYKLSFFNKDILQWDGFRTFTDALEHGYNKWITADSIVKTIQTYKPIVAEEVINILTGE